MATKITFRSSNPAPVICDPLAVARPLQIGELDMNFRNLQNAIDKQVGEAWNSAQEAALFAAGYKIVVRMDLL